jgi:hypothetical protein
MNEGLAVVYSENFEAWPIEAEWLMISLNSYGKDTKACQL